MRHPAIKENLSIPNIPSSAILLRGIFNPGKQCGQNGQALYKTFFATKKANRMHIHIHTHVYIYIYIYIHIHIYIYNIHINPNPWYGCFHKWGNYPVIPHLKIGFFLTSQWPRPQPAAHSARSAAQGPFVCVQRGQTQKMCSKAWVHMGLQWFAWIYIGLYTWVYMDWFKNV